MLLPPSPGRQVVVRRLKTNDPGLDKNGLIEGHIPHTVYGTLGQTTGIEVKIDQLQITAWIEGRPCRSTRTRIKLAWVVKADTVDWK